MNYLTDSNAAICLRMRRIREQAHMTQEKLADALGVSVNYLGEVERGRKTLSHSLAYRFCSYFHISYEYLYHGIPSADWNIFPFDGDLLPAAHSQGVQEQPNYALSRNTLFSQLEKCSAQEFQVISRLALTYLYTARQQDQMLSAEIPSAESDPEEAQADDTAQDPQD